MKQLFVHLALLLALVIAPLSRTRAAEYLLNENFNSLTSGVPAGWDASVGSAAASQRWASAPDCYNATRGLRFGTTFPRNPLTSTLVTPLMDFSHGNYQLSFRYKKPRGGTLRVKLSTDSGATYTVPIDTAIAQAQDWAEVVYLLSSSSAAVRIAFEAEQGANDMMSYIYLDDVVVKSQPTCRAATGLMISDLTQTTARLVWQLTDVGDIPSGYILTVRDLGGTTVMADSTLSAVNLNAALTGLVPATTYTATIEGNCVATFQGISEPASITFTTMCAVSEDPYTVDFDTLASLPDCSAGLRATLTTAQHRGDAGQSLSLSTTDNEASYILFPELNLASDTVEISFFARPGAVSEAQTVAIGLVTDPADVGGSFEMLRIDTLTAAEWRELRLSTASTTEPVRTTAMMCIYLPAGAQRTVYIDDVRIYAAPSCPRPENLRALSVQANEVQLSWFDAAASGWRIGIDDGTTSRYVTANANPYTVTGLAGNTDYTFTVRALCSATDSSEASAPVTVHTECDTRIDPCFTEDFEQGIPGCWRQGFIANTSNNRVTAPFTTDDYEAHSGENSAMLEDMRPGVISYLTTDKLRFDEAGKYQVSVWVYRDNFYSEDEGIKLFITPSATDTVGGTCLGYIHNDIEADPAEDATGWYQYTYTVNRAGDFYLMIVGVSEWTAPTNFDDLAVSLVPNCPGAVRPQVMPSVNTARLVWQVGGSETQWAVDYTLTDPDGTQTTGSGITAVPSFNIAGLDAETEYSIEADIRSICGAGDTAAATRLSTDFTTLCAFRSLPWTETFEAMTVGSAPHCWDNSASTSTSESYDGTEAVWGVYRTEGNSMMRMNNFDASYGSALINTPYIVLDPVAASELRFDYANQTGDDDFVLYINRFGEELFDTLDLYSQTGTTDYEVIDSFRTALVDLTGYEGDTVCFRFGYQATWDDGAVFVDNVIVRRAVTCADIAGSARISSVADTAATVTIADATATQWQVACDVSGTPADDAAFKAVSTTAQCRVTGLSATTGYSLYIRRICGAQDTGAWSAPVSFVTGTTPAAMPYITDFSDSTDNAAWQIAGGTNCFAIGTAATVTGHALYVSRDGGTTYEYNTRAGSQSYAARKVHFDEGGYRVEFSWKCTGGSAYGDLGRAMLVPVDVELVPGEGEFNYSDIVFPAYVAAFDPETLDRLSLTQGGAEGWNDYSGYLDMRGRAGDYNLVFMWNNGGMMGNQSPLAVRSINIQALSCTPPDMAVVNLGATAADLTLATAGAGQYEVVVATEAFTSNNVPAAALVRDTTTAGVYHLTGLTPNTDYYYTARAICSAGDTGAWRTVGSFTTYCSAETLPYSIGFDSETDVRCWQTPASTGTVARNTANRHHGTSSLSLQSAIAASPELIIDSLGRCLVTGWVMSNVAGASLDLGVIIDPADPETYITIGTVTAAEAGRWTEFTIPLTDLNTDDYSDFSAARHLALSAGADRFYVDDIYVETTPSCAKPQDIVISNITGTTIDVAFTDPAGASAWSVLTNGDRHIVTTNPATITCLTPVTDYTVQVAAICQPGDTSRYTETGTIRTACVAQNLPWSCGFEQGDGFATATGYVAGAMQAACWDELNVKAGGRNYPYAYIGTGSTKTHTGAGGLVCYDWSSGTPLYVVLPEFADPVNRATVSLWYKNGGTGANYHSFTVGYLTAEDASSFVAVTTLPLTTDWSQVAVDMSADTAMPAMARLAIRYTGGSAGFFGYIDDIEVTAPRTCSDPAAPIINAVTNSTATIMVTDTAADHSVWQYVYGPQGFVPTAVNAVPVDSSRVIVLTDLAGSTCYDICVRAVCEAGTESNWVRATFCTSCDPYVVTSATPFIDSFEDAVTDAIYSGCYTLGGQAEGNNIKGRRNETTGVRINRYARTGDGCIYSFQNANVCPDGHTMSRSLVLRSGVTYHASVYGRSETYPAELSLEFSPEGGLEAPQVIESELLSACSASMTQEGNRIVHTSEECYSRVEGYFAVPADGIYNVAVHGRCGAAQPQAYIYYDDLTVEEAAGCAPLIASVDSISYNMAHIVLNDRSAGVIVRYSLADGSGRQVVPVTTDTASAFSLTGLTGLTTYTLSLKRVCSAIDTSAVTTITFTTEAGQDDCVPLTLAGVTIDGSAASAATITVHDAEGREVHYAITGPGVVADTVATGTIQQGDSTAVVLGLNPGSTYTALLAAVCDSARIAAPVAQSFTTDCGRATLPYSQGFETLDVTYTGPGMLGSLCWSDYNAASVGTYPRYQATTQANRVSEGNRALQLLSSNSKPMLVIMPEMDNFSYAKMTCDVLFANAAICPDLAAGYVLNADSAEQTFVTVAVPQRSTSFAGCVARFDSVPDGARIAFRYETSIMQGYSAYIDNIHVVSTARGPVYRDTICYADGYHAHGFDVDNLNLTVGLNRLTRFSDTDTLYTALVVRLPDARHDIRDTICAGLAYNQHGFDIAAPATQTYRRAAGSNAYGCDSTVWLYLTVLPGSAYTRDTICAGTGYVFGDTLLTETGLYVHTYNNERGCVVTDSLLLEVVSDTVRLAARVCGSDLPYAWHDRQLSAAGVYTESVTGTYGCSQTEVLTLTVLQSDSVVDVVFCHGGYAQVVDTFIHVSGAYVIHRVSAEGCDITYHITATELPAAEAYVSDYVCEGSLYYGNGINGLAVTADTVVTLTTQTAMLCDSITHVTIHYVPTVYTSVYDTIADGDTYDWDDQTLTRSGDYTATLVSAEGCDSVVTLHLTVEVGVDNVSAEARIRVVPNPVTAGQAALLHISGIDGIARVEIINSLGALIRAWQPSSTPIDIVAPAVAGVYHVRVISRDGRVAMEKLVVR